MKHTFKKVAVAIMALIMCLSAVMPVSAADAVCPGQGKTHTAVNCTYEVVKQTAATCEEDGHVTGKCVSCNVTFVVSTATATGHTWSAGTEASCTTAGVKTCTVCNASVQVSAVAGHKWDAWVAIGGCEIGANRTRTCTVCAAVEKDPGMKDDHSWVLDSYVAPATCMEPGVANYVCENKDCGAKKSETIYLVNDTTRCDFDTWEAVKGADVKDPNYVAPKCTTAGQRTEACKVCERERIVEIAKTGHLDRKAIAAVAKTCTTAGSIAYWQCYDCGMKLKTDSATAEQRKANEIPIPASHNYTSAASTLAKKSATCELDGFWTKKCDDCGAETTETLKALGGHAYYFNVTDSAKQKAYLTSYGLGEGDWNKDTTKTHSNFAALVVNATCTTGGYTEWKCLNKIDGVQCPMTERKATTASLGHKYSEDAKPDPALSMAATCTTDGVHIFKCERTGCTEFKSETIAKLGHDIKTQYYKDADNKEWKTTCIEDGKVHDVCKRTKNSLGVAITCDYSTDPVVEKSTGAEHVTALLKDASNNDVKNIPATCTTDGVQTVYCTLCPTVPFDKVIPATDHKYAEANNDTKAADITALVNAGKLVVYQVGHCAQKAIYKAPCQNGCGLFVYREITKGFGGGHDMVLLSQDNKPVPGIDRGTQLKIQFVLTILMQAQLFLIQISLRVEIHSTQHT